MRRPELGLGLLAALAACAPPPPVDTGCRDSSSSSGVAAEPDIRVVFPASSQDLVYCSVFPIAIVVQGFTLSAEHIDDGNTDDEGHWHLLDGDDYLFAGADEWTIVPPDKALAAGRHALTARLVSNDHQNLEPNVSWTTEITVDDTHVDTDGNIDCIGGGTGSGSIY